MKLEARKKNVLDLLSSGGLERDTSVFLFPSVVIGMALVILLDIIMKVL